MSSEWSLTARWVFPVDAPPLERGILTIAGDHIAAVEPYGTRTADYDLGNAAILPGLVNAHTHLDLSGARGKCRPTPDFISWLRTIIESRRDRTPSQVAADVQIGLRESLSYGTTLIGDISAGGLSWSNLEPAPLRAVVFYELLGLTEDRAGQFLAAGRDWLDSLLPAVTCHPGLSPHAPYSVRSTLITEAAHLCYNQRLPMAIHLAESLAEVELLHHRRGPFV